MVDLGLTPGPEAVPRGPRSEAPVELKVFLSFAKGDAALARGLKSALRGYGIDCWSFLDDQGAGSWASNIPDAIEACQKVVVILSKAANGSPWIPDELLAARNRGRPIIPFSTSRAFKVASKLELFVNGQQWAFTVPRLITYLSEKQQTLSLSKRARLYVGLRLRAIARGTALVAAMAAAIYVGNLLRQDPPSTASASTVESPRSTPPVTPPVAAPESEASKKPVATAETSIAGRSAPEAVAPPPRPRSCGDAATRTVQQALQLHAVRPAIPDVGQVRISFHIEKGRIKGARFTPEGSNLEASARDALRSLPPIRVPDCRDGTLIWH